MQDMFSYLNEIAIAEGWPLSKKCLDHLSKVTKSRILRREEFLLSPGELCDNLYFIKKGLLKCFYIVRKEAVIDWFFGELETVVSVDSFYDQVLSDEYIQALEDCELYYISFDDLSYLYRTFVEFNVLGRVLTNKYLRIWHKHARNIKRLNANERYVFFLDKFPGFANRVPVRDLASFLDMSRETLSRVRARMLNE